MSRSALFDSDAQQALVKGIHLVRDAVKVTMGPKGKTVVIQVKDRNPIITKDGVSVAKEIQPKDEKVAIGAQLVHSVAEKALNSAGDGCQPYTEQILSPKGWITFADIKAGDTIFGSDGKEQKVLKVYEKEARDIYKVYFNNGSVVECTADHLWTVTNTRTNKTETMKLEDIIASGLRFSGKTDNKKYKIPNIAPLEYARKDIDLPAYFMGLYLGNGCQDKTRVTIDTPKQDIVDYLCETFKSVKVYDHDNCFRVKIAIAQNPSLQALSVLSDCKAKTKFIPEDYLYNDIENREALYRGLMDTDGSISRGVYYTSSSRLAEDVCTLMKSLGINARVRVRDHSGEPSHECKGKIIKNGVSYEVGRSFATILIDAIEKTDRKEPVRCIKVSNKDELYITSGYILTHNTSTATVLSGAIVDEGMKYATTNANLNDIRKGIEAGVAKVVEKLKEVSHEIDKPEQLYHIATISSNGDKKLGKIVADAYAKVGKDGVVSVEESKDRDITLEFTEGMRVDKGYTSPYFINDVDAGTVEYENPYIMLADCRMQNLSLLLTKLQTVANQGKPIVIIAESFDTGVLNNLILNRAKGLNIACVDAPGYGERKTEILRDMGIYLGGRVAEDVTGVSLDNFTDADFGTCEKIIIKKDETIIRGGKGDQEEVQKRVERIKKQLEASEMVYEQQKLRERLGALTTGVATIRVGGSSEEEVKELKDRLDDAQWSVKSAMEEGFVPGSGRTLAYLSDHIDFDKELPDLTDDQKIGIKILKKAMKAPFETILENADENPDVYALLLKDAEITEGYNVATMKKVNLVEDGVIDATKVVRCAIQAASSIASLVLTTSVVITQDPEEPTVKMGGLNPFM